MTKIKANQADIEDILNDPLAGATETKKGTVEIATQVEVDAGTDTERSITPLTLKNFAGTFEPADPTILKDADIGVTVQGYSADTLFTGDIGISIAAFSHSHSHDNITENGGIGSHATITSHIADSTIHFSTLNGLSDVVIGGSP